jgi:hypothetical protein
MKSFRDEIREKLPKMAERASRSRLAAVRLFCIECMGGSARQARACETTDCFLWPVRGASWSRKEQP